MEVRGTRTLDLVVMIAITAIGLVKYHSLREINPAQALKNE